MRVLDLKNKKVTITGGHGFLGRYVVKLLKKEGVKNIFVPSSKNFNLKTKSACKRIAERSDIIINLAAKMGGIGANMISPYDFLYENLIMGALLLDEAIKAGVEKFITSGTVCEYPKIIPVPFKEESLWYGYPEETNGPYGIAKRTLLVQGQAARTQYGFNSIHLLLVNLYGPGDSLDLQNSHVIPAMIQKFYNAKVKGEKKVTLWGSGFASREFLFVEDAARAIILATKKYNDPEPVNIGSGMEIVIKDLAEEIKKIMGLDIQIVWDKSKPDGQPRRLLDISKAKEKFGFKASTSFETGLNRTIDWYLDFIGNNKRLEIFQD